MTKILATNCDGTKVAIAMDSMANPHCVWVDGGMVKYSRFQGGNWILANGEALVSESPMDLSISKHCIGFDDSGNCFFAFSDGNVIRIASWSGIGWLVEDAFYVDSSAAVLSWGVAWGGFPIVMAITGGSTQKIVVTDKSSGSWSTPSGIPIPPQDNKKSSLKASKVASWVYAFWTGEDSASDTTWIGHSAWDMELRTWVFRPSKKIQMSLSEGAIENLDFAVGEELLSSSSSSLSSINSSSSSSVSSSSLSSNSSLNSPSSQSSSSQSEMVAFDVQIMPGSNADVSGSYYPDGTFNGMPYYVSAGMPKYYVWNDGYGSWVITTELGGYGTPRAAYSNYLTPDVIGTYVADGYQWSGQAYILDDESSSSFSSVSSDSSSSSSQSSQSSDSSSSSSQSSQSSSSSSSSSQSSQSSSSSSSSSQSSQSSSSSSSSSQSSFSSSSIPAGYFNFLAMNEDGETISISVVHGNVMDAPPSFFSVGTEGSTINIAVAGGLMTDATNSLTTFDFFGVNPLDGTTMSIHVAEGVSTWIQ